VGFPVFEEPSGRGGREKTKANEKNYSNQDSHSERHAASLVLAVLYPAADAAQETGMTNQNSTLRRHITLIASELNTPKGAGEWAKVQGRCRHPGGWPTSKVWVPHLRRGLIATNRGPRQLCWWGELGWAIVRSTILIVTLQSDVGHPSDKGEERGPRVARMPTHFTPRRDGRSTHSVPGPPGLKTELDWWHTGETFCVPLHEPVQFEPPPPRAPPTTSCFHG